ncbi:MAG: hypothetical protein HY613_09705, partial [Candidatus Rokubacteria bacterium]|nr:hypothetical protein [Candidatus Rokubacteria bacterium]
MNTKWVLRIAAVLIGTAVAFPPATFAQEKREGKGEHREEMKEKMRAKREEMRARHEEWHKRMNEEHKR